MSRRVLLFTDSTAFGYDVIAALRAEGLLDEVYVQVSTAQTRLRRYLNDLRRWRGIRRRLVGLVDRLNRSARRMSIEADEGVLQEIGAIPFVLFKELRSRVSPEGAILVVYGTGIVPSWIYKGAFQTINVHWGLSPYYRGILCTDWAVLNRDLRNIGFTLHELSSEADGGQIITQGRVDVVAGDSIGSITTRLHNMAKPALVKAVAAAQHQRLSSVPQDLRIGKNYRSRDWTIGTSMRLRRLTPVSQRALERSGPELPIHECTAFKENSVSSVAP